MFEDHVRVNKRKRDDVSAEPISFNEPDVPSFPMLSRPAKAPRSENGVDADVVPHSVVQNAFQNKHTGDNQEHEREDYDEEQGDEETTYMLPGDELSSDDESDNVEENVEDNTRSAEQLHCPCCELATSEVVRAMDSVADTLAGRAGDGHITRMQLEIYNRRMAPLRREGRDVPVLTREILLKHYRTHRVSVLRSVAEEIRVFELMERTLRRTGLCDLDADGRRVLVKSGAQEMNRLSKSKLDLLKFYATLEKQRREDEANAGSK